MYNARRCCSARPTCIGDQSKASACRFLNRTMKKSGVPYRSSLARRSSTRHGMRDARWTWSACLTWPWPARAREAPMFDDHDVVPDSVALGARLRHYRVAAGLTQLELAEQSGLSVRAISDL